MARSNSPGYPNLSLPKAITAVRKIFHADRRNPIDRVVAAKHIGYAGQSGASDKALASLAHYGLVERTGKGELRVSQLALDILHPDPSSPDAAARHLLTAGLKPAVFADLFERFGAHVSEGALKSYLIRENFQNIAINPVTNAYFETLRFLEQSKAFESGGTGGENDADPGDDPLENDAMNDLPPPPAVNPPIHANLSATLDAVTTIPRELNKINMNVQGSLVHLAATLDRKGIVALKRKLTNLEALLDDDEDTDDAE